MDLKRVIDILKLLDIVQILKLCLLIPNFPRKFQGSLLSLIKYCTQSELLNFTNFFKKHGFHFGI